MKKLKKQKKSSIKRILMLNNYNDSLFNNKIKSKSQQRFKSEGNNIYTEEIDKIALISNDDERFW